MYIDFILTFLAVLLKNIFRFSLGFVDVCHLI